MVLLGWAEQFCPATSDLDFLCNIEGVVDLDAEVATGTFYPDPGLGGRPVERCGMSAGVVPKRRRNTRWKSDRSPKPAANAMSRIVQPPYCWLRSMRRAKAG
jgi:hypothetical protein